MRVWESFEERRTGLWDQYFYWFSFGILLGILVILLVLLAVVFFQGWARLNWSFLTEFPSRFPDQGGILPALFGTALVTLLGSIVAFPLGVGAAIYLEEYARQRFGVSIPTVL